MLIQNRLIFWPAALIGCLDAAVWSQEAVRPNILFICASDLAFNRPGFAGQAQVKTPNLDALAARSVRFTRCYITTPQDAPARATLLTGQYPHTHKVTNDDGQLTPFTDTFTVRLKQAGYKCGVVGAWHLPAAEAQKPGFGLTDFVATHAEPGTWKDCDVFVQGEKRKADKYLTDWEADRGLEFLDKFKSHPFLLWFCFQAPHMPIEYPPGFESLYPPTTMPASVPATEDEKFNVNVAFPPALMSSLPMLEFGKLNDSTLREARSKYFAMLTRLDDAVGRILKHLEETGLKDRTLVVFTSVSGFALGEQHLFSKGAVFSDPIVRVPLLVAHPAVGQPGGAINHVVSTVDIAPTLLESVGLPTPITMQGHSLLPLVSDPNSKALADERFFEYHEQDKINKFAARGVITPQFKFIDYQQGSDALYDLKRDPREQRNVAEDPAYAGVVHVLRDRVSAWRGRRATR